MTFLQWKRALYSIMPSVIYREKFIFRSTEKKKKEEKKTCGNNLLVGSRFIIVNYKYIYIYIYIYIFFFFFFFYLMY